MGGPGGSGAADLPTGTVTFLLTDIEGSTRLWEEHPTAMATAVARHSEIIGAIVAESGGVLLKDKGEGDSTFAVFGRASDALGAALDSQRSLASEGWPAELSLRVRMAIHTGEAELRDGDYYGSTVNRTARLREMAHGGQVLCSKAAADLIGDAHQKFELIDLGERRLRDLARAEHVLQLAHPSLRREFPPLRSLEALPNNLPVQLTSFVGRHPEMTDVAALVREHRLVTLTGAAGSGKTRLALQVAADVLPEYRDGVWFVELAGLTDPAAVAEAVGSALGVTQQPGETLVDTVISFLRNKQLLLILDNCEHLIGTVAHLVETALAAAQAIRTLTTSREPLAVRGERIFAVPSLPVPAEGVDADDVAAADAVELFVERARAARSGFELTPDNALVVAQLCRRLDGIPLAIELAAARVRSMAPADISARLDQRFRLLTGGTRSATSRHQTLRRAIDWSYDLLDDAEKELLGRLSVCLGGFDLVAAEAIGAGGAIDALDVDDVLSRLVDKSLVTADDHGDGMRYRMLETIRAYAFEALEAAGGVDGVRDRHALHYADVATEAGAGLKTSAEREWLDRVEDELDNLRAAVTWSLEIEDPGPAVTIVSALALNGLRIEPVVGSWAAAVVGTPGARADPRFPVALAFMAWMSQRAGRAEEAGRLANEAELLIDQGGHAPLVVCRVLGSTTGAGASAGRNQRDRALEWVAAAQLAGDRYEESHGRNMASVGETMSGEDGAATAADALAVARASGNPTSIAYCAFTAALSLADRDATRAAALLDEVTHFAGEAGNDYALLLAADARGSLLSHARDHDAAARAFLDAARRWFDYGHRSMQGLDLWNVAGCLAVTGRPEPAAVLLGWVEPILDIPELVTGDVAGFTPNTSLSPEAAGAVLAVPSLLGSARYEPLSARGAAMSDADALAYAAEQLGQTPVSPVDVEPSELRPNEFRREGDVWTIGYEGQVCRLRDAKGLRYLATLLAQPGREVHVADLAGAGELSMSGTGARLDAAATAAYKARVAELEEEIDEATRWSDDERAARAREELDALTGELTAAYGLGGRARQDADPVERIRKAVTNRIRDAIGRLEAEDPGLGRHLRNGIRTGTFCSYVPERPTPWDLSP